MYVLFRNHSPIKFLIYHAKHTTTKITIIIIVTQIVPTIFSTFTLFLIIITSLPNIPIHIHPPDINHLWKIMYAWYQFTHPYL